MSRFITKFGQEDLATKAVKATFAEHWAFKAYSALQSSCINIFS